MPSDARCNRCNPRPASLQELARQALVEAAEATRCRELEQAREWQGIAHTYVQLIHATT